MCIIFKDDGQRPVEYLKSYFSRNSDGFGVIKPDGTAKGIGCVDDWLDFYHRHKGAGHWYHLRFATHGAVKLDNCHPFSLCDGRFSLMHNGIINQFAGDRAASDTRKFADALSGILREFPEALENDLVTKSLEAFLGTNRVIVFDHELKKEYLFNRHQWVDVGGVLHSNRYSWDDPYAPKAKPLGPIWDWDNEEPAKGKWQYGTPPEPVKVTRKRASKPPAPTAT